MTEGVLSILKKEWNYTVDGKMIRNYKLALFSITEDKILGYLDYYKALDALKKFFKTIFDNFILVELNEIKSFN